MTWDIVESPSVGLRWAMRSNDLPDDGDTTGLWNKLGEEKEPTTPLGPVAQPYVHHGITWRALTVHQRLGLTP